MNKSLPGGTVGLQCESNFLPGRRCSAGAVSQDGAEWHVSHRRGLPPQRPPTAQGQGLGPWQERGAASYSGAEGLDQTATEGLGPIEGKLGLQELSRALAGIFKCACAVGTSRPTNRAGRMEN
eukprot:360247-Chlamydomonas_euryale.AAC.1